MEESVTGADRLLVIGGSAGSLEVLLTFLPKLRADVGFAIILVLHRKQYNESTLIELISSKTKLNAKEADDKDKILPGWIYVAPADYHLLIEKDQTLSLDYSEKVNFSRPCIDVSFKTASETYRDSLIGILLSGANADGAEGLQYIKQNGGTTAVQDPRCAEVSYMPEKAIEKCKPDFILNTNDLADFINAISEQSA